MPLYIGDYLAGTAHLNAEEHGAYLLLLMHCWMRGPMPDNDKVFRTVTRVENTTWDSPLGRTLRPFFRLENGLLYSQQIAADLAKLGAPPERREFPANWAQLRQIVFARDGYTCRYCGEADKLLHCDHVVSVRDGGSDDIENLTTACRDCNLSKGAKSVVVWLAGRRA